MPGRSEQDHVLRVLHISDLHERAEREKEPFFRVGVLEEAWNNNLQELLDKGPIDIVVFTGDIADFGLEAEYLAVTSFLRRTLEHLNLGPDRLFVVPGNHDINRSVAQDVWRQLRERASQVGPLEFSRWMAGEKALLGFEDSWRTQILQREAAFWAWVQDPEKGLGRKELLPVHSPHGTLGYRHSFRLEGKPFDVHVLGFDTAWLSGDDHDAEKLRLTRHQVEMLGTMQGRALSGFRLALMHHPLSSLADGDENHPKLAQYADFVLRGHLHVGRNQTISDPDRKLHILATGSLFDTERGAYHRNGCQVLTFTLDESGRVKQFGVRFRSWSPEGGHWHDDPSIYHQPQPPLPPPLPAPPSPGPPGGRSWPLLLGGLVLLGVAGHFVMKQPPDPLRTHLVTNNLELVGELDSKRQSVLFAHEFTEHVRRDLEERYGLEPLLTEGLTIFTTLDGERQRAAKKAVDTGVLTVDKRQGYRGPVKQLGTDSERQAFIGQVTKALRQEELVEGQYYLGLVTSVSDASAEVQVGPHVGTLPLLGMRWARKVDPERHYQKQLLPAVDQALSEGDVIVVRHVTTGQLTEDSAQGDTVLYEEASDLNEPLFRLEQLPLLQGALISVDPHRQYLVAMVGGYDFTAGERNRAVKACRSPGSTFMPLVYSAAMEKLAWTPATVLVDSPIVEDSSRAGAVWKPDNSDGKFEGDIALGAALVRDKDTLVIKAFAAVGIANMVQWTRTLGVSKPLTPDFSAARGTSCVSQLDLANVYATFNRNGRKEPTYFIRKIEDRFGRTVEDHTAFDDPWATLQDRVAAGYARLFEPGEQVMSPETGFILTSQLRDVVKEGLGDSPDLDWPVAGKEGNTLNRYDAWFAGYTTDLVTVSWVGYDQKNSYPLGPYEKGRSAALPIWHDYMKGALANRKQDEFTPPEWLKHNLVQLRIDLKTGMRASNASKSVKALWFKKGTEPKQTSPSRMQVQPEDFLWGAP